MATYCLAKAREGIRALRDSWIDQSITDWRSRSSQTYQDLLNHIEQLELAAAERVEASYLNNYQPAQPWLADVVIAPTALDENEHVLLCHELTLAQAEALKETAKRLSPGASQPTSTSSPIESTEVSGNSRATELELTFGQLASMYLDEKLAGGMRTRSENEYRRGLALLTAVAGDLPVSRWNGELSRQVSLAAKGLKKGVTTAQLLNEELASLVVEQDCELSLETVNSNLTKVRLFLEWCQNHHHLRDPYLPPLHQLQARDRRDDRPVATEEEILAVNSQPLFTEHKGFKTKLIQHPHHYWLPLLMQATGARLGELSQLVAGDVEQVGGIWCIRIDHRYNSQQVKTANARRFIPLHSEILRLGFLVFVEHYRAQGDPGRRLFPSIGLLRGSYSNKPSEWFISHYGSLGTQGLNLTPHQFRHTFRERLVAANVTEANLTYLMGHFGSNYGSAFPRDVRHLKVIVEQAIPSNWFTTVKPFDVALINLHSRPDSVLEFVPNPSQRRFLASTARSQEVSR
ncbi:site-specific integrase [Gallaecimonas pentaromativorans]|nr:site-specific integrase [Gallaecimonas pentaromativorans]